jgi:NhaP-type Na+/H+ and K+/H+ antiporter
MNTFGKLTASVLAFFAIYLLISNSNLLISNSNTTNQTIPAVAPSQACNVSNIELDQVNWKSLDDNPADMEHNYLVAGQITNKCQHPTGVRIAIVFRDAAGQVLQVERWVWPASIANIPPDKPYPFSIHLQAVNSASVTVTVDETHVW